MRTLFVILLVSLVSFGATAQTTTTQTQPAVQKIGYAEWDYIFSQLPEFKQIDNDLKTHGDQLQAQLQAKYKEYETKLKTYQASASTMVCHSYNAAGGINSRNAGKPARWLSNWRSVMDSLPAAANSGQ